ncbi:IucA/IucC family siderophore biosynthesis protein [Halobacillus sp. Marseille-P3879]|uniref:IucA/IucC family protein n=1 Tax=Halobacillus sp. Marseille-P3879 TaxID=2045014 RepID=UPI000C7CAEC1|nr:IucA/IucC family protein [Halobacillus sp. Marseille-P3879]
MKNAKSLAEKASMQSFLNCYLRETDNYQFTEEEEGLEQKVQVHLKNLDQTIIAPVRYWSPTGRHSFSFPIYLNNNRSVIELDYVSFVSAVIKELSLQNNRKEAEDELMLRVLLSCQKIQQYIAERQHESEDLLSLDFTYIDAEQSLLLGHLLHPTPKSKQGLSEQEDQLYSPERQGEFQLHYFKVKNHLLLQDSSLEESAAQGVKNHLLKDQAVDQRWLESISEEQYSFLPIHPLQAKDMLENEEVNEMMEHRDLFYLGPVGSKFKATSSFRTVYNEKSDYMFKFSLPIKITNSLRGNLQKELDRGVEISRLLRTEFGDQVKHSFPGFHVIEDPAYIKLNVGNSKIAYDAVMRENPFKENNTSGVTLIAGLCQEQVYSGHSRLYTIINQIAASEGRSTAEVSKDWFSKYLSISLDPILWLFKRYGLALEAHQQNSLIKLSSGYPAEFYYRDNQGYYFSESKADELKGYLPSLNHSSDTVCTDEIAVERLRYYFFFNHLFGLINSFGSNGLVSEYDLLGILREKLELDDVHLTLINSLLNEDKLPCKANLLTRFHDMDELQGSLATQSVYKKVNNPLASKVGCYEA